LSSGDGIYAYIPTEFGMPVVRTRTFRSGNSEALRLPRDVAFGADVELVIVRSGDVMTIYPAATSIPAMIERLRSLPSPSAIERRDVEELPERTRL
jgi:antitoxin VapB